MPGIEIKGQSKRANYRFGKKVVAPITHAKNIISAKKFKKKQKGQKIYHKDQLKRENQEGDLKPVVKLFLITQEMAKLHKKTF